MMKAVMFSRYGVPKDVLKVSSVPKPTKLKDNQVLIEVHASSINAAEQHVVRGWPYIARFGVGWPSPKPVPVGFDVAGVVVEVGRKVDRFKVGDHVYGAGEGTWAEYAVAPVNTLALKPHNLSWAEAGSVAIAAMTALQGIQVEAKLQAGQSILIIGASGGVGTYAVQIAKATGAEVTGVCSTRSVEMVKRLGADHVIDFTKERWEDQDKVYDCVFQLAGTASPSTVRSKVTPTGTAICSSGEDGVIGRVLALSLQKLTSKQKLTSLDFKKVPEPLDTLRGMFEDGHITPELQSVYVVDEAAAAFAEFEQGKRGKIVLVIDEADLP